MRYTPVIGLEIHAEMSTKSKVFCTCSAEFGGDENSRCCPRCMGLPGTLPVVNVNAVELAAKAGMALECKINLVHKFDRKNYFYPDLPKAYQITQLYEPICEFGSVNIGEKDIRVTRIHIEEDAGKLTHNDFDNISMADYNRCGVPLIEIVTEPDIASAEEAKAFVEEVALRLKYAGVCDGKMEEGSLRVDVNISLMPIGSTVLGTRAEIKNLNSLKSIVRAIAHEIERQSQILDKGERVIQETRSFNDNHGTTKSLRSKEEAHDYRYFPEPDIQTVIFTEEDVANIRATMPKMPKERLADYVTNYSLSAKDAELLVSEMPLSDFYDKAISEYNNYKGIANFILVELLGRLNDASISIEATKVSPTDIAKLVKMSDDGVISKNAAKDILKIIFEEGGEPEKIAKEKGFIMTSDTGAVTDAINQVVNENEDAVLSFKNGNEKIFGFLMGQVTKKLGKGANPQIIKSELTKILKGG